jgi:hypothetical protein
MTLRCLWVASNVNAERVLGGLENNTKSAVNAKQALSGRFAKSVAWLFLLEKPGLRADIRD